uniref:FkbM family methyltransferase n=1 Tax=Ruegeria sp. 6PALISEP08 TaxID=1225660 RepID=UPI00067EE129
MFRRNANKSLSYSPPAFVTSLYEQLLGRTPTSEEIDSHVRSLLSGEADASAMIERFVASDEYAQRALSTSAPFINAHDQFGEIALLLKEWACHSVADPVVVDVGARGRDRSNSYDLMAHFGWRGLLVEANPVLLSNIQAEFNGLNCIIVGTAVSDYNGSAEFTIGVNDDVSSLDPAAAASWGETRGAVQVNVRCLPELLKEHGIGQEFGLLSLDIEGEDVKVLTDLVANSNYRPDYIIIEASQDFQVKSLDALDVPDIVRDTYEIFAQTRANLLLRHVGKRQVTATPSAYSEPLVQNSDLVMSRGVEGGYWVTHRNDAVIGAAIRQTAHFQEQAIDD